MSMKAQVDIKVCGLVTDKPSHRVLCKTKRLVIND